MAVKTVPFRNFSGGINTRDAASELAENEFPYALNVTIDERGGLQKRLGMENRFTNPVGTGLVSNLFWWSQQGKLVQQIGTGMHLDNAAAFHTWSTSARVGMCEFLGNLVMIHPVDGLRVYDAATVTTPTNGASVKGNTIWPWQNKLWSGGDPASPPRLRYTDIGSANTTNTGTQFNDLRERDSELITNIIGASGQDISGRPGLLVCKQDSTYRVHDSSNGAYTTIDTSVGCGSNVGAVSAYGRVYVCSTKGIYSTDGLGPMEENSRLIENFFHKDQINQNQATLYAAGRYQDRLYFSFPLSGETENSRVIEYHPLQGWVTPHTNAGSCYASIGRDVPDMVIGSPSVDGRCYNSHAGGSDAGTDIESSFQTRWIEIAGGNKGRVRRARFVGAGAFDATMLKDYEVEQSGRTLEVDITSDAAIYDSIYVYDDPSSVYGPLKFQDKQDFWHVGVGRAIAFFLSETSSVVGDGRPIMGSATVPQVGGWQLSHINTTVIELGNR